MTKLSDQLSEFAADKANLKHASLFLAAFAENLKAADIQISRRLLVIIVSMVLFELLTQGSGIKSISVFGVDLNDLTFVQLALPVLISYLYMSFAGYFSAYSYIQDAYDAIIKAAYPELFQCNLDLSLKPISDIRIRRRPSAALFAAAWDRALEGRASSRSKQPSTTSSKGHKSVSVGWRRMVGEVIELPLTSMKGHKVEDPLFSPIRPSKL
jgi:hypothetical protein